MTLQLIPETIIQSVEADFAKLAVVHGSVNWDAEQNYAIQQLYKSKFAVDTAVNNPVSVQNAVRNIAAIGLTLNPALKYAYLVPRDKQICLDVSYMGLMHLAQDTGSVLWSQCKLVHQNDQYTNKGASVEPLHEFQAFGDRGEIVGAYCVVKLPSGDFLTHEMQIADIFEIRNRSMAFKNNSGPWKTDEKEMIKKTVVKQASKYWPKVERMNEAIQILNDGGEGIDFDAERRGYTDEQRKKYHHYLESGTPIEFQGFILSLDEEAYNSLYNSFEKGDKSKGKARASKKEKEGMDSLIHIRSQMQSDDEEIKETALDGLNEIESKVAIKFYQGT